MLHLLLYHVALAFVLCCTCLYVALHCVALAFALLLLFPTMSDSEIGGEPAISGEILVAMEGYEDFADTSVPE